MLKSNNVILSLTLLLSSILGVSQETSKRPEALRSKNIAIEHVTTIDVKVDQGYPNPINDLRFRKTRDGGMNNKLWLFVKDPTVPGMIKRGCNNVCVINEAKEWVVSPENNQWMRVFTNSQTNIAVGDKWVMGISTAAILVRLTDRTVENNIFYKGANPPSIHRGYENNHDVFRKNIVVVDTLRYNPTEDYNFVSSSVKEKVFHFIGVPERSNFVAQLDSNCYSSSSGKFQARVNVPANHPVLKSKYMNLEEWQSYGLDKNSLIADPLFTDPENGDFSLEKNSPAFNIGFEEFPLLDFGLRNEFQNIYKNKNQL